MFKVFFLLFLFSSMGIAKDSFELLNVHEPHGGSNVLIHRNGSIFVSIVKPNRQGNNLSEKRYLFFVDEQVVINNMDGKVMARDFFGLVKDEAEQKGRLVYDGKYEGIEGWKKFVAEYLVKDEVRLRRQKQAELKKIFSDYLKDKVLQVDDISWRYNAKELNVRVFQVYRPIDQIKDPPQPRVLALTENNKVISIDLVRGLKKIK